MINKFFFLLLISACTISVNAQDKKSLSAIAFLDSLEWTNQKNNTYLYFESMYPVEIKRQDIKTLLSKLNSKEKCKCLLNAYSSFIPSDDYAEIGGIAALLIEAYRNEQELKIGRYTCPKVDKNKNNDLMIWWREHHSD